MKVCPNCLSANIRIHKAAGGHRCRKCNIVSTQLKEIDVDQSLYVGRATSHETDGRLARIKTVHEEHPEYTKKDLVMMCWESDYMIEKYFAMNKTN